MAVIDQSQFRISRRQALAGIGASMIWRPGAAGTVPIHGTGEAEPTPIFSPGGPDAEQYGAGQGYPVPGRLRAAMHGNPYEPEYRVGAFSRFDEMETTRRIQRAAEPWSFRRAQADIRYSYRGKPSSIDDYLARNPVMGLLIAKDSDILGEHYQYARTDRDRFLSQSMAKSIMGLLIGIAVSDGAIKSVDDTVETYAPAFNGSEYGRTPIRALLHMSSGVEFREEEDDSRDLDLLWKDMVRGRGIRTRGTVESIRQFNRRIAPAGTRFFYASVEPDVLGQVLHGAVGISASAYLQEKVWQPIGAEADATWFLDAEGYEVAHFGFSAVLRDYARLGRLLAHDGAWEGRQIIPAQWMIDATTVRASEGYLAPGRAMPDFGYGYLLYLLPGKRRQFAFVGAMGQRICIDPASKLVMVHTALDTRPEVWRLWNAVVEQFG